MCDKGEGWGVGVDWWNGYDLEGLAAFVFWLGTGNLGCKWHVSMRRAMDSYWRSLMSNNVM